MIMVCPACGCRASVEAWEKDADQRIFLDILAKLPRPVAGHILRYCGLFRSPGANRAMSWKKARRIGQELAALVATGHVQGKGKVARPCSPQKWGEGMDRMIEMGSTGQLSLPMTSHNYLISIVWQDADKADATAEASHRKQEATGHLLRPDEVAQLADRQVGERVVDENGVGPVIEPQLSQLDRSYIATHGREAWEKLGDAGKKKAFEVKLKKITTESPDAVTARNMRIAEFFKGLSESSQISFCTLSPARQDELSRMEPTSHEVKVILDGIGGK